MRLCACGCGKGLGANARPNVIWRQGHNNRSKRSNACKCGCGQWCPSGKIYIEGHWQPPQFSERLWSHIAIAGPDDCWRWTASTIKNGYGVIGKPAPARGTMLVHRAVYEERVGPIPDGYQIDHLCRVTACCNPAHLEAVTQKENLQRQSTAMKAARTHCKNGHAYADHGHIGPAGNRYCRTCNRANGKKRHLRRRSAAHVSESAA